MQGRISAQHVSSGAKSPKQDEAEQSGLSGKAAGIYDLFRYDLKQASSDS
jgi:hypothetical protein